ncbi:hypothetical protein ACH5RR_034566 [Cinchona calisaya]|uniref:RNase H type-1 domain-containing protein n=1 Tax=Cinchona calisaya TaxID=153742 RepID=A0ABD2YBW9_9GENT
MVSLVALNCFQEFRRATCTRPIVSVDRPMVRWLLPLVGRFKINFDAVIFSGLDCCGVGIVVRDHAGTFIVGISEKIKYITTPNMAETLAVPRAIELGAKLSMHDFFLEGDALGTIKHLNATEKDLYSFAPIAEDTKIWINHLHVESFN